MYHILALRPSVLPLCHRRLYICPRGTHTCFTRAASAVKLWYGHDHDRGPHCLAASLPLHHNITRRYDTSLRRKISVICACRSTQLAPYRP